MDFEEFREPEIIGKARLNFPEDVLYVWQEYYDPLIVKAMSLSKESGHSLEMVNLVQTGDHVYQLLWDYLFEGGTHRSMLGFQEGFLEGNLVRNHLRSTEGVKFHKISDIVPISNDTRIDPSKGWAPKLLRSINYLPSSEIIEFCIENNVNLLDLGLPTIGRNRSYKVS